jgi:aryl-alcohol dehydrogenase-like predicted oxidoreductase
MPARATVFRRGEARLARHCAMKTTVSLKPYLEFITSFQHAPLKLTLMEQRFLGKQGLRVSSLGLGCMGMSEFYGATDEGENIRTLERSLELGMNFWDTADMYGPYLNEQLLGRVLRKRRDSVVLATKFGFTRDPNTPGSRGLNASPEYVASACEASLKRLETDVIDLYYMHRLDPLVPIEDTVGAMAELVQQGKVRYLGLSEVSSDTLRRANAVHPISAVQSEYSLWSRDVETSLFPALNELGVGFVPYSPLGRGFLTGQVKSLDDLEPDDFRRGLPRFQPEHFQKNLELLDAVRAIASAKGCTPSQLALAWVLAQGADFAPIPGTKRVKYLEENAGAATLQLTPPELERLAALSGLVSGERYSEAGMRMIQRS